MQRFRVVWFALFATVVACDPWATPREVDLTATFTEQVDVAVGSTVALDGGRLILTFDAVPEDSRCPVDVVCVWSGNAEVELTVGAGTVHEVTLNTTDEGTGGPGSVIVDGYRIALVGLDPAPVSTGTIPSDQYVASLEIAR